jgi:sulfate-transporting ATPase
MNQLFQFAILGLGTGAIYAMVAQGIVVVYNGSGVLNFAQGAFVLLGAYSYHALTSDAGLPTGLAVVFATAIGAVVGAAVHLGIMRPMHRSSAMSRLIATLAVMLILQSIAVLMFGVTPLSAPSAIPSASMSVFGVTVGEDRMIILLIGAIITVVLSLVYRLTQFGRITAAVAERPSAAAALGHSPNTVAAINWAIGAGLAAFGGCLIAPITFLDPTSLILLVLPALAAALVGKVRSFSLAFIAACVIGVGESWVQRYIPGQVGLSASVPFVIVIVLLVLRGRPLPIRGSVSDRPPAVGSGRIRYIPVLAVAVVLGVLCLFVFSPVWSTAITVTLLAAVICLSVVVVTGYGGQLSLAQYVLAGGAALVAAQLSYAWHWNFLLALLAAVIVTMVLGFIIGLPAIRTRGINLAVVTLGLGVVISAVILKNPDYTGGLSGITVRPPTLFGWQIDNLGHPGRYAAVAIVVLTLVGIAVANLRRGSVGRQMLAVRSNERAAAALGINVAGTKLYAFTIGAGIAAIGGVFLAFMQSTVLMTQFDVLPSVNYVSSTVVGGVGSVGGGLAGSTLISGGFVSQIFNRFANLTAWLSLIGAVLLVSVLIREPGGLFEANARHGAALWKVVLYVPRRILGSRRSSAPAAAESSEPEPANAQQRVAVSVPRKSLEISDLSVSFGGVHALRDVSLTVRPGEIHGLIGPNGAGKTTFIDAVTGFTRATAGSVVLDGTPVSGWSPRRRAHAGLGRSFQTLELFDDLTVQENVGVASEVVRGVDYVATFGTARDSELSASAREVVQYFGLENDLDTDPHSLPYGRRRLVAIARALARLPSVLLLDEPASGLDDQEAAALARMIKEVARDWGIGILLVEHNTDVVFASCDVVTVLANGAVIAHGSAEVIQTDPAVLEAYLGVDDGESNENATDEPAANATAADMVVNP